MTGAVAQPSVAVVIPCFQMEGYIARTLASVIDQGLPLEVVVVDDGSADASVSIARSMLGDLPGSSVIENRRRKGVCGARNTGIEAVRAPWTIFLDADDLLLPGAVSTLLEQAEDGVAAVIGGFVEIDENDGPLEGSWRAERQEALEKLGSPGTLSIPELARYNVMPPPGAQLHSTQALRELQGFDEHLMARGGSEDYEILVRLAGRGRVASCEADVLGYRRRSGSQSSRSDHHWRRMRSRAFALRRSPRWQRPAAGRALAARYAGLGLSRLGDRGHGLRSLGRGVANLVIAGAFLLAGLLLVAWPEFRPSWRLEAR